MNPWGHRQGQSPPRSLKTELSGYPHSPRRRLQIPCQCQNNSQPRKQQCPCPEETPPSQFQQTSPRCQYRQPPGCRELNSPRECREPPPEQCPLPASPQKQCPRELPPECPPQLPKQCPQLPQTCTKLPQCSQGQVQPNCSIRSIAARQAEKMFSFLRGSTPAQGTIQTKEPEFCNDDTSHAEAPNCDISQTQPPPSQCPPNRDIIQRQDPPNCDINQIQQNKPTETMKARIGMVYDYSIEAPNADGGDTGRVQVYPNDNNGYTCRSLERRKPRKDKDRCGFDDDDVMHFKSLLPYIKQIPSDKKLQCRTHIQNIVTAFAFPEAPNQSSSAHSQHLDSHRERYDHGRDDDSSGDQPEMALHTPPKNRPCFKEGGRSSQFHRNRGFCGPNSRENRSRNHHREPQYYDEVPQAPVSREPTPRDIQPRSPPPTQRIPHPDDTMPKSYEPVPKSYDRDNTQRRACDNYRPCYPRSFPSHKPHPRNYFCEDRSSSNGSCNSSNESSTSSYSSSCHKEPSICNKPCNTSYFGGANAKWFRYS